MKNAIKRLKLTKSASSSTNAWAAFTPSAAPAAAMNASTLSHQFSVTPRLGLDWAQAMEPTADAAHASGLVGTSLCGREGRTGEFNIVDAGGEQVIHKFVMVDAIPAATSWTI